MKEVIDKAASSSALPRPAAHLSGISDPAFCRGMITRALRLLFPSRGALSSEHLQRRGSKGKRRPLYSDGGNYTKRRADGLRRISEFGIDHHSCAPYCCRCQDGRARRRNGVARVAREGSEAGVVRGCRLFATYRGTAAAAAVGTGMRRPIFMHQWQPTGGVRPNATQNRQTDPRTPCSSPLCRKSPLSGVGTSRQSRKSLQFAPLPSSSGESRLITAIAWRFGSRGLLARPKISA